MSEQQLPSTETQRIIHEILGDRPCGDIVVDAEAHAEEHLRQREADARAIRRAALYLERLANVARQCEQHVHDIKGFGPLGESSERLYREAAEQIPVLQRIADEMEPEPAEREAGPDLDYDEHVDLTGEANAPHLSDEVHLCR